MSVSVITYPSNIDNKALFNVTTSLVEDSSHVNLRIRADVYYEGVIRATVEKPKGLPDFDLSHILQSFTPGLQFAKDSGDIVKCGTAGANLITDVTGTYTTFTNTANVISAAISASARSGNSTPAIALEAGSMYCFYIKNYVNNLGGGTDPVFTFVDWGLNPLCPELIQLPWTPTVNNKSCLLMCVASGNFAVIFTNYGASNWSGDLFLHKITTDVTTYGKPLTNYLVVFTEYWESSTGITTAGASNIGDFSCKVLRYVYAPDSVAVSPYSSFERYVMTDNAKRFANQTIKNNAVKWYSYVPLEYSLCFFTEHVELELFYSKDGGSYNHATHPIAYEGWGAVILNVGEILSTCTTSLAIYLKEIGGTTISETITIYLDNSCIDERVVLEYDGTLGGKDYLAFEGLKSLEYDTIRDYYVLSNKTKKLTRAYGKNRQKIESRFKDMAYAQYLKGLMTSDVVKRLEPSYATSTDVTILTESVVIDKGTEFFTNRLEIEY